MFTLKLQKPIRYLLIHFDQKRDLRQRCISFSDVVVTVLDTDMAYVTREKKQSIARVTEYFFLFSFFLVVNLFFDRKLYQQIKYWIT